MSSASVTTPEERSAGRLPIGAVLAQLTDEFPDMTISKIRFLEGAGLVSPTRTAAGYRMFTTADVERLRFVLRAQRDRFWPLKVIRAALDAMDRGLTPPSADPGALPIVPAATADPSLPTPDELAAPAVLRLTEAEMRQASGLDAAALRALQDYGLLPTTDRFDDDDLAVARAAGRLAGYGIEARHLRSFRTAADREVGLVEQVRAPVLAGSHHTPGPDPTEDVLASALALHVALVRAGLRRS